MKTRRITAAALVAALVLSLVPTAVGANGNGFVGVSSCGNGGGWQPTVGFGVTAQVKRSEMKVSSFLSWNTLLNGESAHGWDNTMPQEILGVPVGLAGVSAEVDVRPFVDMPDGRQSFKQVWVTEFPLFDNITQANPLLCPLKRDPCKGFVDAFVPTGCPGDVKHRQYWALVGGGKRTEAGLYIPVVSNFMPNAFVRVTHNDSFQRIGDIQYRIAKFPAGFCPRDATELGNRMVIDVGSGGVVSNAYAGAAEVKYNQAMEQPLQPGGYYISFLNRDGSHYDGFIDRIEMQGSTSHVVGEDKRGPVMVMGPTTPKTYRYTFWVRGCPKPVVQDFTVGGNSLIMKVTVN